MTLSFHKVVLLMEDFTYKPNWDFRVANYGDEVRVIASMWVPDSTRPFRPVRTDSNEYNMLEWGHSRYARNIRPRDYLPLQEVIKVGAQFIVPNLREHEFYTWLRGVIRSMEDHELDEWFKVKGIAVNDPHAQDKELAR